MADSIFIRYIKAFHGITRGSDKRKMTSSQITRVNSDRPMVCQALQYHDRASMRDHDA